MCGIAGILELRRNERADPIVIRRMCQSMVHRGPDDEGIYSDGPIGLGMRRLSIIDLSAGRQPISNEDGRLQIVFNGEIYNHAHLRVDLSQRGHQFKTNCDTEAIVHLYEEYGRNCVQHLRGMFAFAIWDRKARKLFIARDRLGIKPLYYCSNRDRFLFGSEIKVLLAGGAPARFHREILPEYLAFGYVSGDETFYSGIRKLMPGHWLEISESGELLCEQYWDVPQTSFAERGEKYYVETYGELLRKAVSSHLMSDVPVGVFLSGGLDSSAVAALMARERNDRIETFSVGYSEQRFSELPYARAMAEYLNSVHHEVLVSEKEFFDVLPNLIRQEDEPLAWPSSVALYFVARLARERVKVVLTGEGSDETLAGYSRYAFTLKNASYDRMYRSIVPGFMRRQIRNSVENSNWIGANLRRKLAHTFLAKDGSRWEAFYFDNFFSAFSEKQQANLFTSDTVKEFEPGAGYRNPLAYWQQSSGEFLQRLLYTDIKTYLVELLMKQDNMSMAASIESRVPFLDHELVEFAAQIPQSVQIRGMEGKRVLKKAMQDLLPRSIIDRKKMGFPTPWATWIAGPRLKSIRDLLLEPRSLDRGLFQRAAVERLFNEHEKQLHDHGDRIWRLLNLELWQRVCLEGFDNGAIKRNVEDAIFAPPAKLPSDLDGRFSSVAWSRLLRT